MDQVHITMEWIDVQCMISKQTKFIHKRKMKSILYEKFNIVFIFSLQNQETYYKLLKLMQAQKKQSPHNIDISIKDFSEGDKSPSKISTLCSLIDQISFEKKKTKIIKKTTWSDTSSISSSQSIDPNQKSKLWTDQENEKFLFLLKKHGPDFQLLGKFFNKKSKNQLKNKYKQFLINEKKKAKQQESQLKALSLLFKQVDQKQEQN